MDRDRDRHRRSSGDYSRSRDSKRRKTRSRSPRRSSPRRPKDARTVRKSRLDAWKSKRQQEENMMVVVAKPEKKEPKKSLLEQGSDELFGTVSKPAPGSEAAEQEASAKKKPAWTLDGSDGELSDTEQEKAKQEEKTPEKKIAEPEVELDPLDAFMLEVGDEVSKLKPVKGQKSNTATISVAELAILDAKAKAQTIERTRNKLGLSAQLLKKEVKVEEADEDKLIFGAKKKAAAPAAASKPKPATFRHVTADATTNDESNEEQSATMTTTTTTTTATPTIATTTSTGAVIRRMTAQEMKEKEDSKIKTEEKPVATPQQEQQEAATTEPEEPKTPPPSLDDMAVDDDDSETEEDKRFREELRLSVTNLEVAEVDLEKVEEEEPEEEPQPADMQVALRSSDLYYEGDEMPTFVHNDEDRVGIPRELKAVDHEKMFNEGWYIDFQRNFFMLPKDMQGLTDAEISKIKKENDSTKVKDPLKKCPPPIVRWDQAGLPDAVHDVVKKLKFEHPLAIQAQALPVIMSGRDVLACACTGSGKTLAFLLPMLRHILAQPALRPEDGPMGLVLGPTRELALQIHAEARKFTKPLSLRSVCVYGGAPIADQIAEFKRQPHIAIATPGRMTDMLIANRGKVTNLRRVTYLVFDEADRMFDMGFGLQVEKLVSNIRPDRQCVMFSATFPKQVEAAAKQILRNPVEITIGGRSAAASNVSQFVELFDDDEVKFLRLLQLLGEWVDKGLIIIFVDTQQECDDLYQDLFQAQWTSILELHGGMDQIDREYTLHEFKTHTKTIMVSTSVCARGLDIIDLELVINYNTPNHYEDYVHRVGRTGRAGKKGTAYTFFTRGTDDKMAMELVKALESSNNEVPDELQAISATFWEKAKLGLVVYRKGGYGGSGYKFNTAEGKKKKEMIKKQARAMGLSDEISDSDEDDGVGDADDVGSRAATRVAQEKAQQLSGGYAALTHNPKTMNVSMSLAQAQAFAAALTVQDAISQEKASRGHFTGEVEINDYPQRARWSVTTKEAIAGFTENYNVQISAKGIYTAKGKPAPGTRKLYLFIEGTTEKDVRNCKKEIERNLGEIMAELATRGPEKSAFGNLQGTGRGRMLGW